MSLRRDEALDVIREALKETAWDGWTPEGEANAVLDALLDYIQGFSDPTLLTPELHVLINNLRGIYEPLDRHHRRRQSR